MNLLMEREDFKCFVKLVRYGVDNMTSQLFNNSDTCNYYKNQIEWNIEEYGGGLKDMGIYRCAMNLKNFLESKLHHFRTTRGNELDLNRARMGTFSIPEELDYLERWENSEMFAFCKDLN